MPSVGDCKRYALLDYTIRVSQGAPLLECLCHICVTCTVQKYCGMRHMPYPALRITVCTLQVHLFILPQDDLCYGTQKKTTVHKHAGHWCLQCCKYSLCGYRPYHYH